MTEVQPLSHEELRRRCDPSEFSFETTTELKELLEPVGQARAVEALRFGVGIPQDGYNLYALGPSGVGKHSIVRGALEREAARRPPPSDWCYVNNFEDRHTPVALRLPAGRGTGLRRDMDSLVEELRTVIPATLESEEYRGRVRELDAEIKERQEKSFRALQEEAEKRELTILSTPQGFAVAHTRKGEVITPEEYAKLSEEEQKRVENAVTDVQARLADFVSRVPRVQKERREREKAIRKEFTGAAVGHLIEDLKKRYTDLPDVLKYLNAVEEDVIGNVRDFVKQEDSLPAALGMVARDAPSFTRYQVNVLVDHDDETGVPIVYEDNPTHPNLVGRIEHRAQLGALVADFTLIRPGALHRANGGYLMLDARKVLMQPYAWENLKRVLFSRKISIESLGEMLGVLSTVTLNPEPIPLDVKVVLLGDRLLYHLLCALDPEFKELFKVAADFDERIERDAGGTELYAQLIGTLARRERLRPFHRTAVARAIEHSSRLAGDAERLSTHMRSVTDLLREADYWAGEAGRDVVEAADVQQAVDSQVRRVDRVRERLYEEIGRGTILIDTQGEKTAQVNGLSVIQLGDFAFGQPSRITATTRLGGGKVIDIEREVELGGKLHSKGVLILSSFLASRYSSDQPLSLAASLVFEQSYGQVDGDSASVAELCVLLSALADAPIRQSLAVTGSVNQHGQVQAIGGVNEKIEGFFDVCRKAGLTGDQGVLIPASNVKHLMLREDVAAAAAEGTFHVYAVETVDDAVSMLTGIPAGERDSEGEFPEGTVNHRVERRLKELFNLRRRFLKETKDRQNDKE